jgi:uncharacterized membrane protein
VLGGLFVAWLITGPKLFIVIVAMLSASWLIIASSCTCMAIIAVAYFVRLALLRHKWCMDDFHDGEQDEEKLSIQVD